MQKSRYLLGIAGKAEALTPELSCRSREAVSAKIEINSQVPSQLEQIGTQYEENLRGPRKQLFHVPLLYEFLVFR
jgi:hypothetical protein